MENKELIPLAMEIHMLSGFMARITMQNMTGTGILAEAGISMLQYGVLKSLHRKAFTIVELSAIMMVDPSTLVSVIDALERKGLAERGRDPNDRRRVPITLTSQGHEIVNCHPSKKPFYAAENPLIKSINALGAEQALSLRNSLKALVGHMPEGEEILNQISTKLHMHLADESLPNENQQEQHNT